MMESAEQVALNANQVSLFDDDGSDVLEQSLANIKPWDLQTRLRQEKTAMGFYFSGHLFDAWRDEVRRFAPLRLDSLEPSRTPQWFAGILTAVRVRMTRRGRMLYAMLDDGTAQVEVSIFNEVFEAHRAMLREDQLVVICGKVSHDDYTGGLRVTADEILDLQSAREQRAKRLSLRLTNHTHLS